MQSGPFNVTIFDSQDNILYRFNTSSDLQLQWSIITSLNC